MKPPKTPKTPNGRNFGVFSVFGGSELSLLQSSTSAALLVAAAAAFAGCASPAPLPDRSRAPVLETFARDHDGFRTLSASVTGNSERGSFSGVVFIDRDGRRFRLLAWKLGGAIAIFDLLVANEELRLLVPGRRRLLVRPLDDSGADLPVAAYLATLFRPRAPIDRRAKGHAIGESAGGRATSVYRLDPRTLALVSQELPAARLRIDFAEPVLLPDGRVWPTRMAARDFSLAFEDIVFDGVIDDRKFEMRVPPGTTTVKTLAEIDRDD